jgi:hypothetical protein
MSYKSVKVTVPVDAAQPKRSGAARLEVEPLSKKDVVQPRLRIVLDPSEMPIPTIGSNALVPKDMSQPPNRYFETRKVNSKAEAKGEYKFSGNSPKSPPPQFVGTSFTHLPNAANRPLYSPPKRVTVPRPQPVLTAEPYYDQPPLSNRTMSGRILGTPGRNFVPEANIPYFPPDEPVGPDNPVKPLNDTWTACWDNEAGATYYYNQITGEATWLPPEL